jgi:hypothetical protein
MRRLLLPLLALLLALPSAASAKEVTGATVCGTDGCRTTGDHDAAAELADTGALTGPPKHAAPYYTVRIQVTAEGRDEMAWTTRWSPELGLGKAEGENGDPVWFEPGAGAAATLRRLSTGLRPFPAAGLEPLAGPTPGRPGGQLEPETTVIPPSAGGGAGGGGSGHGGLWALGGAGALALAGGALLVVRARRRRGDGGTIPAGA